MNQILHRRPTCKLSKDASSRCVGAGGLITRPSTHRSVAKSVAFYKKYCNPQTKKGIKVIAPAVTCVRSNSMRVKTLVS